MKQLVICTLGVLFSWIATAQDVVTGTIKGADGKKLYLFSDENNKPVDSLLLKDGLFSFTLKAAKEPAVHALILEGVDYPLLFVPGKEPIQLVLNSDKFPVAASVKGNEDTRAMQAYQQAFQPLIKQALALNAEASLISGEDEAAKQAFREKAGVFNKAVADTGKAFIKRHPKQLASLWLLINELRNQVPPEEFAALFASTDKSLQTSKYGKRISQYLSSQQGEGANNGTGMQADDFSQEDIDGKPVKLSSFRGKYVLVDFWASWCGPCRAENPNVVKAYNKFKDKNFTILGISLDDSRTRWLNAIKQDGLTWTHVSDLKGWNNAVAAQYSIRSIPANLLIDPEGRIIARNLRGRELEATLEQIMK